MVLICLVLEDCDIKNAENRMKVIQKKFADSVVEKIW